jgi:hypothetical protein
LLLTRAHTAQRALHEVELAAALLGDPETLEHLVIAQLATRHIADRALLLIDDLDDELEAVTA